MPFQILVPSASPGALADRDTASFAARLIQRGGSDIITNGSSDPIRRFLRAMYQTVGKANFIAFLGRSGYNVGTGSTVLPLGGLSAAPAIITGSTWSTDGLVSTSLAQYATAPITLNLETSTFVAIYSDNVDGSTSGVSSLAGGSSTASVALTLLGNNGGGVSFRGTRGGVTWLIGNNNAAGWNVAVACSKSGDQRLTHNGTVITAGTLTGSPVALPFFRFAGGISGGTGTMTQAVAMLINGDPSYSTIRSIIASTMMEDITLP